jgi:hypothetical protein
MTIEKCVCIATFAHLLVHTEDRTEMREVVTALHAALREREQAIAERLKRSPEAAATAKAIVASCLADFKAEL